MGNKKIWTLDKEGNEVLRDLAKENENFTMEGYYSGEFDGNNYMWHEMFTNFVYDDNGCDYERYGCFIKEGDVVLDIGGNIGIFAHRAEFRGASKVISFEPLTPTFNCLIKNRGPKTLVYKMAVGADMINHYNKKIEGDFINVREPYEDKLYSIPPQQNQCGLTTTKDKLSEDVSRERLNPDNLKAFHENPYTKPLSSVFPY
jgi:FkbM family methyltransferase